MANSSHNKTYEWISSLSERFSLVHMISTGIVYLKDVKTNTYQPFISGNGKYCRYDKEVRTFGRALIFQLVDKDPAAKLWLKPGRLGRHQLTLISDLHQILNRGGIHGKCNPTFFFCQFSQLFQASIASYKAYPWIRLSSLIPRTGASTLS